MQKQVDKKAYNFFAYCEQGRWASYWHQLRELLICNPKQVLEIGAGDKVVASYLKNNTEIEYKNIDIAEDLNPDIIASVDKIPLPDNSFDLVCAFEVLEHLPFEKFLEALKEINRVSKKHVIISLPHWGRQFSFALRLPYFKWLRWQYKINLFSIKHKFDGQHYWEIGKKGFSEKKIKKKIESAGFQIKKDFIAFSMPYHHFFVLEK